MNVGSLALDSQQHLFRTSIGLETDFRRALRDVVLRHEQLIDDVGGDMHEVSILSDKATASNCVFTPNLDEGIEALAALGDQFSQSSSAANGDLDKYSQLNNGNETESKRPSPPNLFALGDPAPLSQKDADDEIDMLTFGQRVDSGDFRSSHMVPYDDATEFFAHKIG